MRIRLVAAALVLLLALGALLAGCAGGAGRAGSQHLTFNLGTDPKTLDPGVATGIPEATVAGTLFEGLMRLDDDKPVPAIAQSHEVKDGGLTYIFKLRKARWSNGDPITAHDFEYAWKRALSPELASEYAYQLYYIKGGEAYNGGEGSRDEVGVKALDDATLEVRLENPTPYFLSLTSFFTYYPLHKATLETAPEDWFTRPETLVGNGPFKLAYWTRNDKLEVVKNDKYHAAGKVKLDKITFTLADQDTTVAAMFDAGQIDMASSIPLADLDRYLASGEGQIHPYLGTYYYRFNVTRAPLDNAKVRKALALAIDRQAIVKNITKAGQIPALAFVPPGLPDVKGDFRENGGNYLQDNAVEQARSLLAEAGYPAGRGFPKLTVLYNTSEGHKAIAEAIQEMWKQNLGIDIELTNQEWKVYLETVHNLDYQISRAGWIGDYLDPMTFLDMWVTGGGNNETGWSSARYDALIETAKQSGNAAERMQAMHEAEAILFDEAPVLPIYYYVEAILTRPYVKDFQVSTIGIIDFREAYMDKK